MNRPVSNENHKSTARTPIEYRLESPKRGTLRALRWEVERPHGRIGIVHGLGDHAARYEHVAHYLADRHFAVEAIDLPGHGASYGARGHVYSWDEYRAAMDLWMEEVARHPGGDQLALLGHSMGCFVAFDWALRNPRKLRGLILSSPPFELVLRPSMIKVRAAQLAARLWPGYSQGNMILPSMLSQDQEMIRAHSHDPLVHYRISARLFLEFQRMRALLSKSAGELPVMTLLLHGDADPISAPAGSARWAREAPAGRLTVRNYPGFLHEVLHEKERASVLADLGDWLEATLTR